MSSSGTKGRARPLTYMTYGCLRVLDVLHHLAKESLDKRTWTLRHRSDWWFSSHNQERSRHQSPHLVDCHCFRASLSSSFSLRFHIMMSATRSPRASSIASWLFSNRTPVSRSAHLVLRADRLASRSGLTPSPSTSCLTGSSPARPILIHTKDLACLVGDIRGTRCEDTSWR